MVIEWIGASAIIFVIAALAVELVTTKEEPDDDDGPWYG
jgi:hypothetical protein